MTRHSILFISYSQVLNVANTCLIIPPMPHIVYHDLCMYKDCKRCYTSLVLFIITLLFFL